MPSIPKKISALALSAMSVWTSGAAETSSGINKDWYHTLVATIPGQMVIAVCLAAVFVSFAFVVKLTQPIEYRR